MQSNSPQFHFDVDESFAKQHNEMLRDTRKVIISGISLFIICVGAALAMWFVMDPANPWRTIGTIALGSFGVLMLIVAFLVPRSVGTAQELYDRYPLVPAIVAEVNPRDVVLMALVNVNANPDMPPTYGAALRTVTQIPGMDKPALGTKVPAVAVGGRRTSRDADHWQEVTPMPIAWATPDQEVINEAKRAIPQDQWQKLEKARSRYDEVKATTYNLLVL
ncbi:DUF3239 domain-containing protein [Corynebacterium aquatimens]|uniref:DUF3239 domain-containing protein n=1 Tax=Corynebacterium aquatimens TaxID=1190508 RepID=A0A931GX79_9CORY|nr:DUF3239 domain-containing protein [Corynebacterium aquatimens]MBG6121034.1 hypothetical protein [Corynebacterium aquatimens]WJY66409.1 hypothetical protein CAQUA_08580 [Corynebacterium aquatimens]